MQYVPESMIYMDCWSALRVSAYGRENGVELLSAVYHANTAPLDGSILTTRAWFGSATYSQPATLSATTPLGCMPRKEQVAVVLVQSEMRSAVIGAG